MSERLLQAKEVAALLSVPVSSVRAETRAGGSPHLELGRYRRYDREAVLDWLEGQQAGQWRKHRPRVRRDLEVQVRCLAERQSLSTAASAALSTG